MLSSAHWARRGKVNHGAGLVPFAASPNQQCAHQQLRAAPVAQLCAGSCLEGFQIQEHPASFGDSHAGASSVQCRRARHDLRRSGLLRQFGGSLLRWQRYQRRPPGFPNVCAAIIACVGPTVSEQFREREKCVGILLCMVHVVLSYKMPSLNADEVEERG